MRAKIAVGIGVALITLGLVLPAGCPPSTSSDSNEPGNSGVTGEYVGAETCGLCHKNLHDNWGSTMHARALDDLEAIDQGTNPDCLLCHSVGYGKDGGFVGRATTDALAGVQCESCHGAARQHVQNVADASLRPKVDIAAAVCAQCHNPFHHALYDEWSSSTHATVTSRVATELSDGLAATSCGVCHSGDARQAIFVAGQTVSDSLLQGQSAADLNAVVCATCHDPHERTNKAFLPPTGHDYQLRYAEVVPFPTPSNSVADVTNPDRFNLCGQCHHSRETTWQSTSRGPHHSLQANYYTGEMPVPDGTDPLLPNQRTVHAFVPRQCVTCHMQPVVQSGEISTPGANHEFTVESFEGCSAVGCHPSAASAQSDKTALQTEVQGRLNDIKDRLGPVSTWEYSSAGGPEDQTTVSDTIKQIRFLYYYVIEDRSLGVHNPEYSRAILAQADALLTAAGM